MHKPIGVGIYARASFYFYNHQRPEVDAFVDVVKEIQKFF